MNPEKQKITILGALGWKAKSDEPCWFVNQFTQTGKLLWSLPEYPKDLNAMHEAEKLLDSAPGRFDQWDRYWEQLETVTGCRTFDKELNSDCRDMTHPTAAQRAEALLRTLNLWDEPNS